MEQGRSQYKDRTNQMCTKCSEVAPSVDVSIQLLSHGIEMRLRKSAVERSPAMSSTLTRHDIVLCITFKILRRDTCSCHEVASRFKMSIKRVLPIWELVACEFASKLLGPIGGLKRLEAAALHRKEGLTINNADVAKARALSAPQGSRKATR